MSPLDYCLTCCVYRFAELTTIRHTEGYRLSGLTESHKGLYANLTLNGEACNAFGRDVRDLVLVVEYESKEREYNAVLSIV